MKNEDSAPAAHVGAARHGRNLHGLTTKTDASMAQIPPNKALDSAADVIDETNVAEFRAGLLEMKQ